MPEINQANLEEILLSPDTIIRLVAALKEECTALKQIQEENRHLQAVLDERKKWFTVRRAAVLNGVSWKDISWKRLKNTSDYLNYDVKKIFDANYGTVNAYHIDVWRHEYPEFDYDEEDI